MKPKSFFKATPLHKEYLLLSLIHDNSHLTQRDFAMQMNVSVAMVNNYLDEYEEKGLIKRVYTSTKTVNYYITEEGEKRRKLLNIEYLESALDVYNEAKEACYLFFNSIINKGYKNVLFYGAGEVAEIMLSVLNNDNSLKVNVLAIIDDDPMKQGKTLLNKKIISFDEIKEYQFDAIVISSYTDCTIVYNKLISNNVDQSNIIKFLEESR